MIVGYARVSTDGQTLDAQQSALAAAGAEKVFAEKVSGAITDRKALAKAIAALGAGDVLLVIRLDRLAPQHQRPPKRPRCGRQSRGRFQILGGRLGGYYLGSWKADADSPWWPR
jgi:hypothetical protein